MCAGSAQVTLVELREGYCTGCNPKTDGASPHKTPKTNQPNQKTERTDRNLLCNLMAMKPVMKRVKQGR